MERSEAVAACVAKMNKHPKFAAHSDDQKAKAAAFAFERLHEDAAEHLAFGCSDKDLRAYFKAASQRVQSKIKAEAANAPADFEQANGFPILLVLGLIPTLWNWWKMFREWMGW